MGHSVAAAHPLSLNLLKDKWYAAQVKASCEKAVAVMLRSHGYDEFVPLRKWRRRWSDRTKEDEVPVFPGYVFFRIQRPVITRVVTVPNVIRIVGFGKEPVSIPESEINAIRCAVESGKLVTPAAFLQRGQLARVVSGSLTGVEGLFVERRGQNRLILSITLLQRSVAVEIDKHDVEPVSKSLYVAGRSR